MEEKERLTGGGGGDGGCGGGDRTSTHHRRDRRILGGGGGVAGGYGGGGPHVRIMDSSSGCGSSDDMDKRRSKIKVLIITKLSRKKSRIKKKHEDSD